jgi:hypothetical protein
MAEPSGLSFASAAISSSIMRHERSNTFRLILELTEANECIQKGVLDRYRDDSPESLWKITRRSSGTAEDLRRGLRILDLMSDHRLGVVEETEKAGKQAQAQLDSTIQEVTRVLVRMRSVRIWTLLWSTRILEDNILDLKFRVQDLLQSMRCILL